MHSTVSHRRENTDDRRRAIALAARQLIVEKGFEGLRTRDIAQRVGINIATLHYHVPSKEALIELVAQSMQQDFKDQALRRPRQHLPPLRQLHMEFEDFRETMLDTPDLVVIFSELQDRGRRDPRIDALMRPSHDIWIGMVEEIYRLGVADGSFRPDLDPVAAATLTTGALFDFWRRTPRDLAAYDRLAAELERAVVNSFRSQKD